MYAYSVYGLTLRSDAAIDGLDPLPAAPPSTDITVHLGAVPPPTPFAAVVHSGEADDPNGLPAVIVRRDGDTFRFDYRDGTRFVFGPRAGTIWCDWNSASTPEDAATYLLGPVLAFALRLRGTLALHASAVVVDGRAVVLVGRAGSGKSTTAAAFAQRGHTIISDDVVPIDWRGEHPYVHPGYPRLRLWSDVAASLFGAEDALPLLTPTWEKRYLDLHGRFQPHPAPIAAFVLLGERQAHAASVEPIGGHRGAIALLRNASMTQLLDPQRRADELEMISKLVDRVPLLEARPSDDLARVGELAERIAEAVAMIER